MQCHHIALFSQMPAMLTSDDHEVKIFTARPILS
jgi:hypothetical protein